MTLQNTRVNMRHHVICPASENFLQCPPTGTNALKKLKPALLSGLVFGFAAKFAFFSAFCESPAFAL
jgi:hypothetical protein